MDNVIDLLKEVVGLQKPVTFREFVTGSDYCNCPDLYEAWLEEGESTPETISEIILSGSLGGGKSYYAAFYLAYRVYILFLAGSPQAQLGLAEGTDVFVLYFSVSITIAKRSGYQYLYDTFMRCKWFTDRYTINKNLKSAIEFTDLHFTIVYASDFGHQIGLNVFAFILDEANFRGPGVGTGVEEQYEEVTELYDQLQDRQLSRFAKPDGSVNALAVLISSASYQSAFAAKRIEAVKGDPHARVAIKTAYETKPDSFAKETFEVFIGAGVLEPCIITSEDQKNKILQQAGIFGTGEEEQFFKRVPINLRPAFDKHLVQALQNHCGVATNISSSFMSNLTYLYKSYVTEDEIPPIFQSFNLEASNEDTTQLIEYLIPDNIRFSDRPHSMFLDLSIKTDTGSISCHRYDGNINGVDMHTRVFTLHIFPPHFPFKTKISKIQQFVIDISQYINLVAFGSDQFQCWSGDTLIPTLRGIIPISEIKEGDYVFGPNGAVRVSKVFSYENSPTIVLRTKRGRVMTATMGHMLGEIYHSGTEFKVRMTPAVSMQGKRIAHAPGFMMNPEYQEVDGVTIDESVALFMGWMTGDGGITKGKYGNPVPYLCASANEWWLVRNIVGAVSDFKYKEPVKERSSYSFRLHKDDALFKVLPKIYGTCGAAQKFIPECIFKSPKSVVDAFLRGLYSSDGSCTTEQIVLTSVSKKLMEQVRVLLSAFYNIKTQITTAKRKYKGDYQTVNKELYHLRSIGSVKRFIEIGFIQQYKMDNLCKAFSVVGKGYSDKVVLIEPGEIQTVYDLEVESSDHLYYTVDCLSHNSAELRQEVNAELGLDDVRISIDSSDVPHMLWQRGLVEGKIKQTRDTLLEKEVQEAIHDWKKHRVLKAKNSSDDTMQATVGSYYLSETIGRTAGSIVDLYPQGGDINLVGSRALERFLAKSGYQSNK